MTIFDVLDNLHNRYIWGCERIHGSMFMFEIDEPMLYIREPIKNISDSHASYIAYRLRQRLVKPMGKYTMTVLADNWSIKNGDEIIYEGNVHDFSDERLESYISGQKYMRLEIIRKDSLEVSINVQLENAQILCFPNEDKSEDILRIKNNESGNIYGINGIGESSVELSTKM